MAPIKLGATKKKQKRKEQGNDKARPAKKVKVEVPEKKKPAKKIIPKKTHQIIHNEERELSDQDIEDVNEYEHFQGFLETLDPAALAQKVTKSRPEKPKAVDSESDMEDLETGSESFGDFDDMESDVDLPSDGTLSESEVDYEIQPRKFKTIQPVKVQSDKLPIKLKDGRLQRAVIEETEEEKAPVQPIIPKEEPVEAVIPLLNPREKLIQTQEKLAKLASEVIEDPDENIGHLKAIMDIYTSADSIGKHYAILTLSAVFRDIIPGYRIRPLTELEKNEKLTKEVKKLRNFEQTLVSQYQSFIQTLTQLTKTRKDDSQEEHKDIAITATCSLLAAAPHFNFRIELINIIVNQLIRKTIDTNFIKCRTALERLFSEDNEGEPSFDGMRLLCKKMKDRSFAVDESVISTFLHLRLLTEMEARGSTTTVEREKIKKKDRPFKTKKMRKLAKEQKAVEKDMKEAEATVNAETRERIQGETLKLAFTTYFRILQTRNKSTMGAALEGLAKFAHLINVDFFGDLLEVLKELMKDDVDDSDALSTRDTLLCIVTAFTLLSGQGKTNETISLDLSKFVNQLYATIMRLAYTPDIERTERTTSTIRAKVNVSTETEMLLRALDAIFFKHRVQGATRLLAFTKRLSTSTLQFPEKSTRGVIELIKRMGTRYNKLGGIYNTDETAGDGTYDAETDALDLSNPQTTNIYEMALLGRHYSPRIRSTVGSLWQVLRDSKT